MLALAIALLFTLGGYAAVIVLTDCAVKARFAYDRLLAEKATMRSEWDVPGDTRARQMRGPARPVRPEPRLPARRVQPYRVCAAA